MKPIIKQTVTTGTIFSVLAVLGTNHMLNDTLQSVIPAVYPLLKKELGLNFTQIGIITLVIQLSASIFQPIVGFIMDKHPKAYALPIGMTSSLIGIISLSFAHNLPEILVSVFLCGIGSSIFHPESSRITYLAAGKRHGLAQSIFQVGGNLGTSLGPLLALWFVTPYGQKNIRWFGLIALIAICLMMFVCKWYNGYLKQQIALEPVKIKKKTSFFESAIYGKKKTIWILAILFILVFSKYVYMESLFSYYQFYLIDRFHITIKSAQLFSFIFLFSVAVGTVAGGPLGDRIGRKYVIWGSILGTAPFALLMPHANLVQTCILSIIVGLVLSSAFSAIIVYAQELLPGKIGFIGGIFFGFMFGVGGIASAALGNIADHTSIEYIYKICSFLPLIGLIACFLPNDKRHREIVQQSTAIEKNSDKTTIE